LAAGLGVSPYYLSRWFLKHTGFPVAAYVNLVRVHAARYLLEHSNEKLDTIAAAVGFHDASHLSREFVELIGCRPGEHRAGRAERV